MGRKAYTSAQLIAQRKIRNAINRTNAIAERFGVENEVYQKQANMLMSLGVDIKGDKFVYRAKEAAHTPLTGKQAKYLEQFMTAQNLFNEVAKQMDLYTSTGDLEGLKEDAEVLVRERLVDQYRMHEFIQANLASIYRYEEENGNVIRGNFLPTWQELLDMRQAVESGAYDVFEEAKEEDIKGLFPDS